MHDHHIIALNAGSNVLRLLPPLVIEWTELERLVGAMHDLLGVIQ